MELVLGSAALVGCTVLLCELLRSVTRWSRPAGLTEELLLEVVSTLQLSCCTGEMVLLGARGGLHPCLALTLTYLLTVLHCLTARGAACNPCGSVEQWLRGLAPGPHTSLRVGAQFVGAALSQVVMPGLWLLGLSPLHELTRGCRSPLHVAPLPGALVEATCALSLFIMLRFLPRVQPQYRVQVVALTVTAIVYAGGHMTGAVFNPALAFAVVFSCQGRSYLQYVSVYWMGPLIGMVLSILALEHRIPKLAKAPPSPKKTD